MHEPPTLPPHEEVHLSGAHFYTVPTSVAAGESVELFVSSETPFRPTLHRIDTRAPDCLLPPVVEWPMYEARTQPIRPGSYLHVGHGLESSEVERGLSISVWLRPWHSEELQGIVSQRNPRSGVGLSLDRVGTDIRLWLGSDGAEPTIVRAPGLRAGEWQHVCATIGPDKVALWLDGRSAALHPHGMTPAFSGEPLLIAARLEGGRASAFLDGDIASVTLHGQALTAADVVAQAAALEPAREVGGSVVASWSFDEGSGDIAHDHGPASHHAQIINRALWLLARVGEHREGGDVPRGLRFAGDDLYDCGWVRTTRLMIPKDAESGLYAVRLNDASGACLTSYDATLVIRRSRNARRAQLLVLCSTATWRAYSNSQFPPAGVVRPVTWPRAAQGIGSVHPRAPSTNAYLHRRGGQPPTQVGLRMPWPIASPDARYHPGSGFSQFSRLEAFCHDWLRDAGYRFDVASDEDLHRDPELLDGYAAVAVVGHSEYWSATALERLRAYLDGGGNLVALTGNTASHRIGFDTDMNVMECRKFTTGEIGETLVTRVGDWNEGILWTDRRNAGYTRFTSTPAWESFGLETFGYAFDVPEDFGVYEVVAPDHALFQSPERVDVSRTFGHGPDGSLPRAIGHEWDVRLSTLARLGHASAVEQMPAEPDGITTLARGIRPLAPGLDADVFLDWGGNMVPDPGYCAEMISWERPNGGYVFNAGSVAFAWALPVDPVLQGLLRNVLHRCGVRADAISH